MSYGYIKGTEKVALSNFEMLLSQTVDAAERKKIESLVQELREVVEDQERTSSKAMTEALERHPYSFNFAPR
jgi:hypothetical protein